MNQLHLHSSDDISPSSQLYRRLAWASIDLGWRKRRARNSTRQLSIFGKVEFIAFLEQYRAITAGQYQPHPPIPHSISNAPFAPNSYKKI
jgi:hypothetical protein